MLKVYGSMRKIVLATDEESLRGLRLAAEKSGAQIDFDLKGNHLYGRSIFMGYDLPNGNGDAIPSFYAGDFGPSFVGKHLDYEHKEDPDNIIGKIMATWHVERDLQAGEGPRIIGRNAFGRDLAGQAPLFRLAASSPDVKASLKELQLEGIWRIDRSTRMGDIVARRLLSKEMDSVSQEASTAFCQCAVCGHKIQFPFDPICDHLMNGSLMVRSWKVDGYEEEILGYKIHHEPVGTGLGVVQVPAFDKAKVAELSAALKSGQMSYEAALAIVREHERMMGQEADRNLITAAVKDFELIAKDAAKVKPVITGGGSKTVIYKGYTIEPSGDNFYVKDPSGHRAFGEVPASIETAKKWIDMDIAEKRKAPVKGGKAPLSPEKRKELEDLVEAIAPNVAFIGMSDEELQAIVDTQRHEAKRKGEKWAAGKVKAGFMVEDDDLSDDWPFFETKQEAESWVRERAAEMADANMENGVGMKGTMFEGMTKDQIVDKIFKDHKSSIQPYNPKKVKGSSETVKLDASEDGQVSCTACGKVFHTGDDVVVVKAPGTPSGQVPYCPTCATADVKADSRLKEKAEAFATDEMDVSAIDLALVQETADKIQAEDADIPREEAEDMAFRKLYGGKAKNPKVYAVWYVRETDDNIRQAIADGEFYLQVYETEESDNSATLFSGESDVTTTTKKMPNGLTEVRLEGLSEYPDPVLSPGNPEWDTFHADGSDAGEEADDFGRVDQGVIKGGSEAIVLPKKHIEQDLKEFDELQDKIEDMKDEDKKALEEAQTNATAALLATINATKPADDDRSDVLASKVHTMAVIEARLARETRSLVRHAAIAAYVDVPADRLEMTAKRIRTLAELQYALDAAKHAMAAKTKPVMPQGAGEGSVPAWCILNSVDGLKGAKFGSVRFDAMKAEIERAVPSILGFHARMTAALASGLKTGYQFGESMEAQALRADFSDFIRKAESERQKPGAFGASVVEAAASRCVDSLIALSKSEKATQFRLMALARTDMVFGKHVPAFAARRLRLPAAIKADLAADAKTTIRAFAVATLDYLKKAEKDAVVALQADNGDSAKIQAKSDAIRLLARSAFHFKGSLRPEMIGMVAQMSVTAASMLKAEKADAALRVLTAAWDKAFDADPSLSVLAHAKGIATATKTQTAQALFVGKKLQAAGGMWPWSGEPAKSWPQFIEEHTDLELEAMAKDWETRLEKAVGTEAKMNIASNVRRLRSVLDLRKQAKGCTARLIGNPQPLKAYWLVRASDGTVLMRLPIAKAIGRRTDVIAVKWASSPEYGKKLESSVQTFGAKTIEASLTAAPKTQSLGEQVAVYESAWPEDSDIDDSIQANPEWFETVKQSAAKRLMDRLIHEEGISDYDPDSDEEVKEFIANNEEAVVKEARDRIAAQIAQDWEEMGWEELLQSLKNLMDEFGTSDWHAEGRNIGWQNRSGYRNFRASDARSFLEAILPHTSDFSVRLYKGNGSINLTVSHHDAPTGETYIVTPATEDQIEASKKVRADVGEDEQNTCDRCGMTDSTYDLVWIDSEDFEPRPGEKVPAWAYKKYSALCEDCYEAVIKKGAKPTDKVEKGAPRIKIRHASRQVRASEASDAYVDDKGVVRWLSNDRVPFDDMLDKFASEGMKFDKAASSAARSAEAVTSIEQYRKARTGKPMSQEQAAEMASVFGDDDVMDVLTGETIMRKGKPVHGLEARRGYFEAFNEDVEILDGPKPASAFKESHPEEFRLFMEDPMNFNHGSEETDMVYLVKHDEGHLSLISDAEIVVEGSQKVAAKGSIVFEYSVRPNADSRGRKGQYELSFYSESKVHESVLADLRKIGDALKLEWAGDATTPGFEDSDWFNDEDDANDWATKRANDLTDALKAHFRAAEIDEGLGGEGTISVNIP